MNAQSLRPLVRDHYPEDSPEAELAELLRARDPLPRLPAATVARLRMAATMGGALRPRRQLPLGATAAAMLLTGAPLAVAWVHVWPRAVRGLAAFWQPAPATIRAPVERNPLVLPPPVPSPPAPVKPAPQAPGAVTPSARNLRERKSPQTVARPPVIRTGTNESAPPIPFPALPPLPRAASAMVATAPVAPARVPNEDAELVAEGKFLKALVRLNLQPAEVLAILAEYRLRFPKQQLGGQADFAELGAHIAMRQPAQALAVVERREASADARLAELQVLHGELLGQLGRCAEALDPFEHELGASPELAERAWVGKASCLTRLGRVPEAQTTLRGYLSRFPQGRFAAQARAFLRAQ